MELALAMAAGLLSGTAWANNIQVTNPQLVSNGSATFVQFDLGWENSWRGGGVNNWDAGWVFVKYRLTDGIWYHAKLNGTGHVAAPGSQIELGLLTPGAAFNATSNPVMGVFIFRDAPGDGTLSLTGVQLNWDLVAQGVNFNDIAEVRVYAIEMVYVNEGPFKVGSGGTEASSFTNGVWTSGNTIPFTIASNTPVNIAQTSGSLWATGTIGTAGNTGGAPLGFKAFYCMKYEASQQQIVDLLNTQTRIRQNQLTDNDISVGVTAVASTTALSSTDIRCDAVIDANAPVTFYCDRNGNGVGNEADDGQWTACLIGIKDRYLTYLNWSGLRPMGELEYEKAARGPLTPVPDEFAWGTNAIATTTYSYANLGGAAEVILTNYSTTAGNAITAATVGTPSAPRRVGVTASNALNTGRVASGSSYYGVKDLSGNLMEIVITLSNTGGSGCRFDWTQHGNGGIEHPTNWSNTFGMGSSNQYQSGFCIGGRGGSYAVGLTNPATMRSSHRAQSPSSGGFPAGLRGIRSAP